jgi:hypothetical protein
VTYKQQAIFWVSIFHIYLYSTVSPRSFVIRRRQPLIQNLVLPLPTHLRPPQRVRVGPESFATDRHRGIRRSPYVDPSVQFIFHRPCTPAILSSSIIAITPRSVAVHHWNNPWREGSAERRLSWLHRQSRRFRASLRLAKTSCNFHVIRRRRSMMHPREDRQSVPRSPHPPTRFRP